MLGRWREADHGAGRAEWGSVRAPELVARRLLAMFLVGVSMNGDLLVGSSVWRTRVAHPDHDAAVPVLGTAAQDGLDEGLALLQWG